jgi:hypothetical protein
MLTSTGVRGSAPFGAEVSLYKSGRDAIEKRHELLSGAPRIFVEEKQS